MPSLQIGSLVIAEPMTVFTDLLITAFAFYFAISLFKNPKINDDKSILAWGVAFIAIGIGAFLGAISHGFVHIVSEKTIQVCWVLTLISIGVVSASVLFAISLRYMTGFLKKVVHIFVFLKFILYLVSIQKSQEFIIAIADYFPVLLLALGFSAFWYFKKKIVSEKYIAFGILISIFGAVVQQSGFDLYTHFNHNDLYHIIQICGLYLIYKGLR